MIRFILIKFFTAEKVESIYDRIEQTLDTINKSESCSLRRTRSLAVIREETFNDLQIGGGIRSRRSQLIPRAKLLNRSFFQNRYKFALYLLFLKIVTTTKARSCINFFFLCERLIAVTFKWIVNYDKFIPNTYAHQSMRCVRMHPRLSLID